MNKTRALMAQHFVPGSNGLRLALPGTSGIYSEMISEWESDINTVTDPIAEALDIKAFKEHSEQYNTLDVACCRIDHIVQRAQCGWPARAADLKLLRVIEHSLSDTSLAILKQAGYII